MTGPDDTAETTRPISVAELLARNGTIGAPPAGGRRRRRRGEAGTVTVAELTGEIPVIRDEPPAETAETTTIPAVTEEPSDDGTLQQTDSDTDSATEAVPDAEATEGPDEADSAPAPEAPEADAEETLKNLEDLETDDTDDEYADAVADYTAHVQQRDADVDLDFFAPPRRSSFASRRWGAGSRTTDSSTDSATDSAADEDLDLGGDDREDPPPYLRSTGLFGGPDLDDDEITRRVSKPDPADIDLSDDTDADEDSDADLDEQGAPKMSKVAQAAWVVGQCVLAVALGAGLFIAFDQLWKWNSIVALVLGVLVILGLVAGVRVVRKTEDIGSTLIAVAVGALVTFGPLALLQAG